MRFIPYLIILIFTSCLFYFKLGFEVLNPLHYMWLLPTGSDSASDFMAWLFFKNDVWRFPIGIFEGYSYPEQVGVGLTGAIPLLAIPLKLFKSILPQVFQYYGIWLFMCYFLQGAIGYKILERLKIESTLFKILGACFIALSYSLLDRTGHLNLCAHWIILLSIYIYLGKNKVKPLTWKHLCVITISILVHPYLVVFTTLIFIADLIRLFIEAKSKSELIFPITLSIMVQMIAIGIIWYVLGNTVIEADQASAGGFGQYSSNLNSFFRPKTDSFFLNGLTHYHHGQYEGIAYLGIGGIILVAIALLLFFIEKYKTRRLLTYLPIISLSFLLFIFSISNVITFNDALILEIPISDWFTNKFSILRASGRYIWLLQYAIIIFSLLLLSRLSIKKSYQNLLLFTLLMLNVIDFSHAFDRLIYYTENTQITNITKKDIWEELYDEVDNVLVYPSYEYHYVNQYDAIFFAFQAAKNNKYVNTGHLARYNLIQRNAYQHDLTESLRDNDVDHNTTYITNEENIGYFSSLLDSGNYHLYKLDGYWIVIPKQYEGINSKLLTLSQESDLVFNIESFQDFLLRHCDNYLIFSAKDDSNNYLINCLKDDIIDKSLLRIKFRDPYIAILYQKMIIKELFAENRKELSLDYSQLGKKISVISIGSIDGLASIKVDNEEYSKNERGLNIVVLDENMNFLESTNFDTFKQCYHFSKSIGKVHKLNTIQ